MATIHEKLRLIKTVDIAKIALAIVAETKDEVIDKNRAQLLDGVDKTGKKLKTYRSPAYAKKKHERNPFPGYGIADLYNTGAFQDGFKLKILTKNSFDIFSSDSKSSDLIKKYGANIFGLNTESKKEYSKETMQPKLVHEVKSIMKL